MMRQNGILALILVWVMAGVGVGGTLFRDAVEQKLDVIVRSKTIYLYPTGGTNDHLMIEAALDNDTCIILIDGLYQITGDITLTGYSNLTIEGMGPQTLIKNVGVGGYSCFLQAGQGHDLIIRNLTVDNNNVGNPYDAFDKCIFINGNQPDPALCYNILVEGVTALNAEAEALCFDYQYYTTVRNCITVDSAWAGITMAQNKYANIYGNKIIRSGNSPAVVGSLCAGINVQSSPYTLVHDNWIHNPWYGGIAISTSMDAYGTSNNCSVYGNIVNGFLTGTGEGNSAGGIDVLISGITATVIPYNIDIFSNHVNQLYLSAVQLDYTGDTNGELNLTCTGTATTPFVDVEVGDKIYLDGDGTNVVDGYYYVAKRDEVGQDWINLSMPYRIDCTPANMEEGDVFSVTVTLNGISSTKSYAALAGSNAKAVVEGLVSAIGAVQSAVGTYPWTVITDAEDDARLMLTASTPGDVFTVTLAVTNFGGSLTPTFTQAPYYGLTGDQSSGLTFLHGGLAPAISISNGTGIKIHNNFLSGKSSSSGIMAWSTVSSGSLIYVWDNLIGANYPYPVRSSSTAADLKGNPLTVPVVFTTSPVTCGYYPRGTIFSNAGDTDAQTHNLPVARAGDDYTFVDASTTDTADLTINVAAASGNTIRGYDGDVAGNTDNTFGMIHLHCYVDGVWDPVDSVGTWN